MKSIKKLGLIAIVLCFTLSAFATTTGYVRISKDATVSGTKLAAGDYKVIVDGKGPDVKVTFVQNGKAVATVSGTLTQESGSYPDSVVTSNTGSGVTIDELHMSKLKGYVKF